MGQKPFLDEDGFYSCKTYTCDNAGNRLSKTTYAYTTGTLGTATATQAYTYSTDAWGNCTTTVASGNTTLQSTILRTYNPFRYRGYFYDTETGLYYLQIRFL